MTLIGFGYHSFKSCGVIGMEAMVMNGLYTGEKGSEVLVCSKLFIIASYMCLNYLSVVCLPEIIQLFECYIVHINMASEKLDYGQKSLFFLGGGFHQKRTGTLKKITIGPWA